MRVGDLVYWKKNTWNGNVIERAGEIMLIVPPHTHPNTLGFGVIVSERLSLRNDASYIVRCQGCLLWESNVAPLTEEYQHLLLTQKPITTKKPTAPTDTRDRIKLKKLMRELNTEFSETLDAVYCPSWKKRFWFSIQNGVEYIKEVEHLNA